MAIRTERLVLRRFRPGDAPALARYRSRPDVARFQSWDAPVTAERAAALVDEFARGDPRQPGWFQYAITAGGVLVGDLGVRLADDLRRAEVGITLDPDHQRRGYATEALLAVLARLFDEQGVHKVCAECDARNDASATLLRRVGFVDEGRRRAYTWTKGEWTDDLLFGLLTTDPRPACGRRG